MDNEAAENAIEIILFCNSKGIIVHNFPAYLGHFLNLCDNRVHSTIQRALDKIQETFSSPSSPTIQEKYSAFVAAYQSVTKEEIFNSLDSIGFGTLKDREEAIQHLNRTLSEGLPKYREQHAIQLEYFLNECIDSGRDIPKSPYNYRLPGILWDIYYDFVELETELK